jgi:tripartite-type tricarboxylate transporter receptor subunit TctC
LASLGAAAGQSYPSRAVRVIVPFAPGGPSDVLARVVAQKLSEKFGKPFYVENIAGAGGNVGTGAAARALPDGYTLLLAGSHFVINPSLSAKVLYDPVKNFDPVTLCASSPHVLAVNPSVPANNVQELIALIRADPGKYSFASPGLGTTGHLVGERFRLTLKLDAVHVPFNGAAQAVTATIGGHVPIVFVPLSAAISNIRDGKLRALALPSKGRSLTLPDTPTLTEAGIFNQEADLLQGVLAPASTPMVIVSALNAGIADIMGQSDVKDRLAAVGFDPTTSTPEDFAELIKSELAAWSRVVQDAKLSAIY